MRNVVIAVILFLMAMEVRADERAVPIVVHNRFGVVLVAGNINGTPAWFIVDTGATVTMVDAELLQTPFEKNSSRFRGDAPGIEVHGKLTGIDLSIGTLQEMRRDVASVDFTEIRRVYGKSIRGVLGQDYLRNFGRVSIDYDARELIFTGKGSLAGKQLEVPQPTR
jgi:hypothetical protein